jgi:plastocyanin
MIHPFSYYRPVRQRWFSLLCVCAYSCCLSACGGEPARGPEVNGAGVSEVKTKIDGKQPQAEKVATEKENPAVAAAGEATFGVLKGQIKYVGVPPQPVQVAAVANAAVCFAQPMFAENLVVGKNGDVANVVVFLKNKAGQKLVVDPAMEKALPDSVQVDNKNCHFVPHIAVLTTTQGLKITNTDPFGHNANMQPFNNAAENPTIASNGTHETKFPQPENLPFKVNCGIHPWMGGWIMVRENPFVGVSGNDGKFEIQGIPVGEYEFVFWHEQGGYLKEVVIGGEIISLKAGRWKQNIVAGDNNLGEIKADAKNFEDKNKK